MGNELYVPGGGEGLKITAPGSATETESQADRLWAFIKATMIRERGYNWITPNKVRTWYAETMRVNGKITIDAMRELMGRHVGFFQSIFDSEGSAYRVEITNKGWSRVGDCKDADELIENLSDLALLDPESGIWRSLGINSVTWVDTESTSEGMREYMLDQATVAIRNNPAFKDNKELQDAMIDKLKGYLKAGDYKKLVMNDDMVIGSGADAKKVPYDYTAGMDEKFKEFVAKVASSKEVISNEKANKYLGAMGISMLLNSAEGVKAAYEGLKKPFDPDAFKTINKIYETIGRLDKKVKAADQEINTLIGKISGLDEEIKGLESKLISAAKEEADAVRKQLEKKKEKKLELEKKAEALREQKATDEKMLAIEKKFFRLICIFSGGEKEKYEDMFLEFGAIDQGKVDMKAVSNMEYWFKKFGGGPDDLLSMIGPKPADEKKPGVITVPKTGG